MDLLKNEIIPQLRETYPEPEIIFFVQDQCPVHQANIIKEYLQSLQNFITIQLPPKGSDLNPIENIWGVMARKLNINPTWNSDKFKENILSVWEYYMDKKDFLANLSNSMTEKFMNVIGMEGHWTKY